MVWDEAQLAQRLSVSNPWVPLEGPWRRGGSENSMSWYPTNNFVVLHSQSVAAVPDRQP